ncbi:50S ribosomal protein L25 [Candidatus Wolfebacteria bacterium]|nr:50S ribosomal protein L25 [Candidatus Wolfebacteria bacterium]
MELQVQKREILGRKVGALRKEGFIPAELYGKGVDNLHLSVLSKEFKKVLKEAGETSIVDVVINGEKHPSLIQGVTYHPLTDEIESVDFHEVRMDEKITVDVPLEFVGVSPAIKEKGGVLVKVLHELEVEALPGNIPHELKVDLSKLEDINQSIYVKDLDVTEGVDILADPDTVLVSVNEKVSEEEELAAQQAATGDVAEVKVEGEEKKEGEGATSTEEAPKE